MQPILCSAASLQMMSVSDLLQSRPDVLSPMSVIGYNTLPGFYSLSRLQAGAMLNTTASYANATDGTPLQLGVTYGGGNTAQVVVSPWLGRLSSLANVTYMCDTRSPRSACLLVLWWGLEKP